MKFTKGKKIEPEHRMVNPADQRVMRVAKQSPNPWIDRRLFDLMEQRAVAAENMCKDLIRVIAVDDGEFLASHDFDYLAAGAAILKGDV